MNNKKETQLSLTNRRRIIANATKTFIDDERQFMTAMTMMVT